MDSEGIAKRRPPRAGPANWRRRRPRHRWSPLALKGESARALPVVVPVAIAGAIGIVAAISDLIANPRPPNVLAGVAALLVAAIRGGGVPAPGRRRERRRHVARDRLDRRDRRDLRLGGSGRRRLPDDGARRALPQAAHSASSSTPVSTSAPRSSPASPPRTVSRGRPRLDRDRRLLSARPRSTSSTCSSSRRSSRGPCARAS